MWRQIRQWKQHYVSAPLRQTGWIFQQDLHKHNRIRPAVAANKLLCNDLPVASFAFQAGNAAVYQRSGSVCQQAAHADIQDCAAVPGQCPVLVRGR
ncbi:MAG: hypothetical protein U5L02_09410 [Rheinheimera sp.]|nr:hypothetical protein [Rheinheimera sp.]